MTSLYEILKASRIPSSAPDAYTALWAKNLTGGGYTPTEHEYTGAVPVTITANGQPLLDYTIYGNTVQNGTPSPDNPIMPQGTGERTGNLFDESNFALVQVTSTAYRYGTSLGVLPQGTYTFNATKSADAQSIYLTAKLNGTYSQTTISSVPFTFTADGASDYIIRTANNTGTTWEAEKYTDMMLNRGSTALPYEPYGYKILISSANTTTPVYLGEVQTTRKIKKLVLDGTESWQAGTENFYRIIDSFGEGIPYSSVICTHAQHSTINNNGKALFMKTSDFSPISSVADFKSYLATQYAAGTPVTVWYVLATPETAVVNEPLMKIGNYADTLSMEQAGVSIPTFNGQTVIDVDTALKPSEMYIKYKG